MKNIFYCIIIISCFFISPLQAASWRNVALKDLSAIRSILLTQTPGPLDKSNPDFLAWLEKGYQESAKMSSQISNEADYLQIIQFYCNGFHDEHISAFPHPSISSKIHKNWPGFFIHNEHGKFLVSSYLYQKTINNNIPPINARLISCDGIPVEKLMLDNVFPFHGFENIAADWVSNTPSLLIDEMSPWVKAPHKCTFIVGKDKKDYKLIYSLLPEHAHPHFAAYTDKSKASIRSINKEIV